MSFRVSLGFLLASFCLAFGCFLPPLASFWSPVRFFWGVLSDSPVGVLWISLPPPKLWVLDFKTVTGPYARTGCLEPQLSSGLHDKVDLLDILKRLVHLDDVP